MRLQYVCRELSEWKFIYRVFNDYCQVIGDASVIDLNSLELVTKRVAHLASKQFVVMYIYYSQFHAGKFLYSISFAYLPYFDFVTHMFR